MKPGTKIDVSSFSCRELRVNWGMSKSTAWRARKRGYAIYKYHDKRTHAVEARNFDTKAAYDVANHVYACLKKFAATPLLREDLIQQAMLVMYESSGTSMDRPYQWVVAKNAMKAYSKRQYKCRVEWFGWHTAPSLEIAELEDEAAFLEQVSGLVGSDIYSAAIGGDRGAIEKIKEAVWT